MAQAIELLRQLGGVVVEVNAKRFDGVLPTEPDAQLSCSQPRPEQALGNRHISPELASRCRHLGIGDFSFAEHHAPFS